MAAEIFQAISALKSSIDGVRMLSQYDEEVKDVQKRGEFMRIIGELSYELAETRIKLSEQLVQNNSLEEEIDRLKREIDELKNPQTKLLLRNGLYYDAEENALFCTGCYDSQDKKIRVSEVPEGFRTFGRYRCPVCKSYYKG